MTASKEPTHQDWAKRFAIACGNELHEDLGNCKCSCGKEFESGYDEWSHFNDCPPRPNYLNPADILREVMKWGNWNEFRCKVMEGNHLRIIDRTDSIYKLITERPPTRLLKEATLFREGKK